MPAGNKLRPLPAKACTAPASIECAGRLRPAKSIVYDFPTASPAPETWYHRFTACQPVDDIGRTRPDAMTTSIPARRAISAEASFVAIPPNTQCRAATTCQRLERRVDVPHFGNQLPHRDCCADRR